MTESEIILTFGENLRRLIKARGLSVDQITKRVNISRSSVFRYMRFTSLPTAKHLAELCNALSCDPAELYGATI